MNDVSRLTEAEWNTPYAEVKDGRKLSEEALTYLVKENDSSLLYWLNIKSKNDDTYCSDETSKRISAMHNKNIKMHKEIERFLEQIEIEENEE